jgi:hypothetical protein
VNNPAHWVSPGISDEIQLAHDVRAFVVRGARPGPIVWAWAPRGDDDPSMAQALCELRDTLLPRELKGAIGLLPAGPSPPIGLEVRRAGGKRASLVPEQYPWAGPVRALCQDAAAVVLLESMLPGYRAAPHVALDLDDRPSRAVARGMGARFMTPHVVTPEPNRAIVTAPHVVWLDGEYQRLEREVVDRARGALASLLRSLGMIPSGHGLARESGGLRVMVRGVAEIDAEPGLVEPAVAPGAILRAGEVAAWVGAPGLRTRRALRAPTNGVVLYARSGQHTGGRILGIGKLSRSLPKLTGAATAAAPRAHELVDVGWCERVSLPELGVRKLEAKIDTGAKTSALHVAAIHAAGADDDGRPLVDIEILDGGRGRTHLVRVPIVEYTKVRDSGGHAERRPVIETLLRLGPISRRVRVSLTARHDMVFAMLVGRTALDSGVRVIPSRRFLLG